MHDVVYEVPGEGSWELEATHFQRPISRFASAAFRSGFPRGFSEGTARYGLLIDCMQPAVVNGFLYTRLAMFGDDRPGGSATPDEMQARIMTSATAFEQKLPAVKGSDDDATEIALLVGLLCAATLPGRAIRSAPAHSV